MGDERRPRPFRKLGIAVLGGVVILVGIVLIPLPGPGWLIVFAGLAILGSEFGSALRLRDWLKRRLRNVLRLDEEPGEQGRSD